MFLVSHIRGSFNSGLVSMLSENKRLRVGGSLAYGIRTPVFDNRIPTSSTQDKNSDLKRERHAGGHLDIKKI